MTGTSDFLPFATGTGANVESQASWETDAAVTNGFSSGIASSAKFNKALRQGSVVAAAITTWLSNTLGVNIADDGNLSNLVTQFTSAIAPQASPALSGVPTAPTAAPGTNTTQLATTAFVAAAAFGSGQSWQNVTGSRVSGVSYTNSTSRPIQILVVLPDTSGYSPTVTVVVGGVTIINNLEYDTGTSAATAIPSFIVPAGATYSLTLGGSGGSIASWCELR